MTEAQLQEQVANYIRLQYPDAMFHSDFGSGVKLTPGQAVRQKRLNGGRRAWPDLFIAEPIRKEVDIRFEVEDENGELFQPKVVVAHGLFIELKRDGTRIKKKDGEWANQHIAEQAQVLEELEKRGYIAKFAVGFDEAKKIIDDYLKGMAR